MAYLRGFENVCLDVAEGRQEILYLRDRLVEYWLRQIERWLEPADLIDGVLLDDDWGTLRALMIHPNTWRKVFKPAYRRLVEAIHQGGCYAHMHTDGNVWKITGDLIEIASTNSILSSPVWTSPPSDVSLEARSAFEPSWTGNGRCPSAARLMWRPTFARPSKSSDA